MLETSVRKSAMLQSAREVFAAWELCVSDPEYAEMPDLVESSSDDRNPEFRDVDSSDVDSSSDDGRAVSFFQWIV